MQIEFKADRKEPLGDLMRRIAALFASSRLEPEIEAGFSDGARPGSIQDVSPVQG